MIDRDWGTFIDLDGTMPDREKSPKKFIIKQHGRFSELHVLEESRYLERFIELDNNGYIWKDNVYQHW